MANLDDDIKYVDEWWKRPFGQIYARTNEHLLDLFQKISVEGENAFTVLSSSDYLFSAIYNGVKSVDTFDINPLTYRYFYLRKWLLEEGMLDACELSMPEVLEIINKHRNPISQDEEDSISFWKYYLKWNFKNTLLYNDDLFWITCERRVIYEDDLGKLLLQLPSEINFRQMNICRSTIDVTKKYDTIFLSNILDHNRHDTSALQTVSENLYGLLNDGGRVILNSLLAGTEGISKEVEVFSNGFTYDEIVNLQHLRYERFYQYQKKK